MAEQGDPQPEGDETANVRKEAAGYRHKLRQAESETERLSEQLAAYRKPRSKIPRPIVDRHPHEADIRAVGEFSRPGNL